MPDEKDSSSHTNGKHISSKKLDDLFAEVREEIRVKKERLEKWLEEYEKRKQSSDQQPPPESSPEPNSN